MGHERSQVEILIRTKHYKINYFFVLYIYIYYQFKKMLVEGLRLWQTTSSHLLGKEKLKYFYNMATILGLMMKIAYSTKWLI